MKDGWTSRLRAQGISHTYLAGMVHNVLAFAAVSPAADAAASAIANDLRMAVE